MPDVDDLELPDPPRLGRAVRRERRTRPTLGRDVIARAALEVIDEEGVEALSMRRVAEKLDTGPASLYAHVESKEALLDLVYDRVIAEMQVPDADPGNWQELVKQVMREQRSVLKRHNDVARIALARIPMGPQALPVIERVLAVLRASGLPDRVVGLAPDLMGLYVDAATLEDTMWGLNVLEPDDVNSFAAAVEAYFGALPADRFPNLRSLSTELTTPGGPDGRFEFGLEVIVRGLASMLAEDAAAVAPGPGAGAAMPVPEDPAP